MRVTIVGAGSWGTALALVLDKNGHEITLWGHYAGHLEKMRTSRGLNALPGVELPSTWRYEPSLEDAVNWGEALIVAVPSKAFREVVSKIKAAGKIVVSVTKGIEYDTGLTMSAVVKECILGARGAAMSGPTFAQEVALGYPTAIVAASASEETSSEVQKIFHRPLFRVYTTDDLLGVELGGALKNVIAIAAGVGDGLGLGDNSKAALVTRAIAEIKRLGVVCGAQPETFAGLSGLGDLTATCYSRLSRNRMFGERIGKGETIEEMVATSKTLAEGYPTARSAWRLAARHGVDTPIVEQVHAMLYEGKNVRQALEDLTMRSSKREN
jgi:glycerol-3-phosphate dehydrogenase (NAD(P)+)